MPPKLTRAQLLRENERLAAEAGRLERSMARLVETNRSLAILLQRAEEDRDTALHRLSLASRDGMDWRRQLAESRALLQRLESERGEGSIV